MLPMPSKPSPFLGRWHIIEMEQWDADYLDMEVEAYIKFESGGRGEFQFGLVYGNMDCHYKTEKGRSYVEFTWEGNDEMDAVHGRGFAVLLQGREKIKGRIYIHHGEHSEFKAVKTKG